MALEFGAEFEAALAGCFGAAAWAQPYAKEWVALMPRWRALAELVIAWNVRAGLTTITTPAGMAAKHFLDSLSLLVLPEVAGRHAVVDVGTGGGFPGLVVGIALPSARLTLIEASRKKAEFLRLAAGVLGVCAEVRHERAEDYGRREGRERFDLGLARAAASLPVSCELVLPLVAPGGSYVAQIGPEDGDRLQALVDGGRGNDSGQPWAQLGASLREIRRLDLPAGAGSRSLAVFAKTGRTPAKYPRKPGQPAKSPLTIR
jgi:16S rRNA (guanine527-N7)-methyltransferase